MPVPLFDTADAARAAARRAARGRRRRRWTAGASSSGREVEAFERGVRRLPRRAPRDRRRQRHRGDHDRAARRSASGPATRSSCRRSRSARAPRRSRRPARPRSSATSIPATFCVTPRRVRAALTPRTKAVIAVHLFGNVAPVRRDRGARACRSSRTRRRPPARQRPGRAPGRARRRSRRSRSTPRRTSAPSATAARSRPSDDALAERVRTLRFHGSADKVTYERRRLQLAPRRAAGRDPARAAAAPRRLGERTARRPATGTRQRASATLVDLPVADARRARRPGTSTSSRHAERRRAGRARCAAPAIGAAATTACPSTGSRRCRASGRGRDLPGTDEAARTHLALPISAALTREQVDEVVGAARRAMRVWVDLTNSPARAGHAPGDRGAARAGAEVEVTARDFAQTLRLCERFGIEYEVIGRHRGGGLAAKAAGLARPLGRAAPLGARRARFDLALGHGSNDVTVAAALLRIPRSTMFDYEWATVQHTVNCRLGQRRRRARGDPARAPGPLRRARQAARATRGSRRSTTSRTSSPTRRCSASWGSTRRSRSPSCARRRRVALYHRFENDLFADVLGRLREQAQVVVLPRTPEQRAELARGRLHRPRARDRRAVADRLRRPRRLAPAAR